MQSNIVTSDVNSTCADTSAKYEAENTKSVYYKSQLFEALRNLIYFLLYTSSNADEDEGIGDDNDEDDDDDDNGDDDDDDDYDEYDNGDDDDDNDARSLLTRFAC